METDKSLIWKEIRSSSSRINKAGGNTIELLLWSRGRVIKEVQQRIEFIISTANMGEKKFLTIGSEENKREIQMRLEEYNTSKAKDMKEAEMKQEEKLIKALAEQQKIKCSQYFYPGRVLNNT